QGGPQNPLFFQRGIIQRRRKLAALGALLCGSPAGLGNRLRSDFWTGVQGNYLGRRDGCRLGRKRAQSAVQFQSQGGEGSRGRRRRRRGATDREGGDRR